MILWGLSIEGDNAERRGQRIYDLESRNANSPDSRMLQPSTHSLPVPGPESVKEHMAGTSGHTGESTNMIVITFATITGRC